MARRGQRTPRRLVPAILGVVDGRTDHLRTSSLGWRRFAPRAGVRIQLFGAALLWLVGTSMLLVRGIAYMLAHDEFVRFGHGTVLIAAAAVLIGVAKARLILIRYATRAVQRIRARGRACFFGLFAPSSWLFVLTMMGGGLLLRRTPLVDSLAGRTFLGVLYIAVGTALAIADTVFWRAALAPDGASHSGAAAPTVNEREPLLSQADEGTISMAPTVSWFQIPASDGMRARRFYEAVLGLSIDPLVQMPGMQMWGFPADAEGGEVGGALICGEGAMPSAAGTSVFFSVDPDLQAALDRVETAGGRILVPKTAVGMEGAGYFAMIADTEGNTVGLRSRG